MSRRRIRKGPRKKKDRQIDTSPGREMRGLLELKKAHARKVETEQVEGRIDLARRHDYRYVAALADELGMSTGRLNRIIDRLVNKQRRVEQKRQRVAEGRQ